MNAYKSTADFPANIERTDEVTEKHSSSPFNGSTKFINAMLTLIVLLLVAAISAQINFNLTISERLSSLETTVKLLMDGKVEYPNEQRYQER